MVIVLNKLWIILRLLLPDAAQGQRLRLEGLRLLFGVLLPGQLERRVGVPASPPDMMVEELGARVHGVSLLDFLESNGGCGSIRPRRFSASSPYPLRSTANLGLCSQLRRGYTPANDSGFAAPRSIGVGVLRH